MRPKLPKQDLNDTGLLLYEEDAPQSITEDEEEKGDQMMGRKRLDFGSQEERFEDSAVMMPHGVADGSPSLNKHGRTLAAKIGGGLGARKERDLVLGVSIDSGTFDASVVADQSIVSRKSKARKKQKEDLDGSRLYRDREGPSPTDEREPRQRASLKKQPQPQRWDEK